MRKWIKMIRFINKYRKQGIGSFDVSTTGSIFILTVFDKHREIHNQLRINQKFWRA